MKHYNVYPIVDGCEDNILFTGTKEECFDFVQKVSCDCMILEDESTNVLMECYTNKPSIKDSCFLVYQLNQDDSIEDLFVCTDEERVKLYCKVTNRLLSTNCRPLLPSFVLKYKKLDLIH